MLQVTDIHRFSSSNLNQSVFVQACPACFLIMYSTIVSKLVPCEITKNGTIYKRKDKYLGYQRANLCLFSFDWPVSGL